jgi:hypothetical protein
VRVTGASATSQMETRSAHAETLAPDRTWVPRWLGLAQGQASLLQPVQHPGAVIKVEEGTSQHVAVAIDNALGARPGGQQRLPPVEETQRPAFKQARCMVTGNGITPPTATLRPGHGYRCSERLLTLPGADK